MSIFEVGRETELPPVNERSYMPPNGSNDEMQQLRVRWKAREKRRLGSWDYDEAVRQKMAAE
jgi:hypothetical protein